MVRQLKNLWHLLQAILANIRYGFPSQRLKVIGVTGTDGKTTTVHLIGHLLKSAGKSSGVLSTISSPGLHTTTPNSWVLQKLLCKMVDRKMEYAVVEASSHGLAQNRLWGVNFFTAVITNITQDHLDYHQNLQNYFQDKTKLFKAIKIAVLNRDDTWYQPLLEKCQANRVSKIVTYGIKNEADFTPKTFPFTTKLAGEYNQYNCLAAIAAVISLGIPAFKVKKAVSGFQDVIGRMEEIKNNQGIRVVVDFAKTANGLQQVLKTLREQMNNSGRLIAVFGSAGERDVAKRPAMGKVGSELADLVILTAEDPRSEDVNQIIGQMATQCPKAVKIPDRQEAIMYAIKIAKKGDLVVVCGKGHERSMCWGKKELPWSDQEEVIKALKERKNVLGQ